MKADGYKMTVQVLNDTSMFESLRTISSNMVNQHSFYIADLGEIIKAYESWKKELPAVQPFYSVNCNDNVAVLELLASLGCGFNCVSKAELSKVVEIGVEPERIIFGNATKVSSHIKHAARYGVELMTFNTVLEINKIKAFHSNPKLVLELGFKEGDDGVVPLQSTGAIDELLLACTGMTLVGVSVRLESTAVAAERKRLLCEAVRFAARTVTHADSLGHAVSLLDLGGGFSSYTSLQEIGEEISAILCEEVSGPGLAIIAEPGSFMVAKSFKLVTRVEDTRAPSSGSNICYIAEGVYSAFSHLLEGRPLRCHPFSLKDAGCLKNKECRSYCIMGATCDSVDVVMDDAMLPSSLSRGDWLVFSQMGSYSYRQNESLTPLYFFISHQLRRRGEGLLPLFDFTSYDPDQLPEANGNLLRRSDFISDLPEALTTSAPLMIADLSFGCMWTQ